MPAEAALAEPGGGMADAVVGPGRVLPPRRVVGNLAALVTADRSDRGTCREPVPEDRRTHSSSTADDDLSHRLVSGRSPRCRIGNRSTAPAAAASAWSATASTEPNRPDVSSSTRCSWSRLRSSTVRGSADSVCPGGRRDTTGCARVGAIRRTSSHCCSCTDSAVHTTTSRRYVPTWTSRIGSWRPTCRGHGRSAPLPGRPTIAAIMDPIEADLDELDIDRVHVLGTRSVRAWPWSSPPGARSLAILPSGQNSSVERLYRARCWARRVWSCGGWRGDPGVAQSRLERATLLTGLRSRPWRSSAVEAVA